jgi:hypothetical protein
MAEKRKRRTKTGHKGVKLLRRVYPSGTETWRARFKDPDTGKATEITLDSAALPTREARRQWAIKKSKALATRSAELASGAPLKTATPITQAIDDFRRSCEARLRSSSVITYGLGLSRFQEWADANGIKTTETITTSKLAALRDYLISGGKRLAVKGGKRGARKKAVVARSPHTTNRELRTIKTMLNKWRRLGLLPMVDKDAITDTLTRLETPRLQPVYLTPTQCQKLLGATLRHDSQVFT